MHIALCHPGGAHISGTSWPGVIQVSCGRHLRPIPLSLQTGYRAPHSVRGVARTSPVSALRSKEREQRPEREMLFTFFRARSEEHTSELQSRGQLVCRLLLEKK